MTIVIYLLHTNATIMNDDYECKTKIIIVVVSIKEIKDKKNTFKTRLHHSHTEHNGVFLDYFWKQNSSRF